MTISEKINKITDQWAERYANWVFSEGFIDKAINLIVKMFGIFKPKSIFDITTEELKRASDSLNKKIEEIQASEIDMATKLLENIDKEQQFADYERWCELQKEKKEYENKYNIHYPATITEINKNYSTMAQFDL